MFLTEASRRVCSSLLLLVEVLTMRMRALLLYTRFCWRTWKPAMAAPMAPQITSQCRLRRMVKRMSLIWIFCVFFSSKNEVSVFSAMGVSVYLLMERKTAKEVIREAMEVNVPMNPIQKLNCWSAVVEL